MKIYYDLKEAEKALLEVPVADRAKLPNQQNSISLTDTVPGDKCDDGGEYGFYTHLECRRPGLFIIYDTCTCDFDMCGTTGYPEPGEEDFVVLTQKELDEMIAESSRIEAEGNQYASGWQQLLFKPALSVGFFLVFFINNDAVLEVTSDYFL